MSSTLDANSLIPESNLPLTSASPTDELRAVRGGKSVRVPILSLPASPAVQEQIDALIAGQQAGQLVYRTWAELSAVTGSAGEGAQVLDDAGTHTDPVVGGTVANSGQYVWSESPAGWRWVRPDALALKADRSAVRDELAAALDGPASVQTIGTADALESGSSAASATFIFASPVVAGGFIRRIRAYGASGGPRVLKVRRFTRAGNVFTQVGSDVEISVAGGANELVTNIAVNTGEYVGFYSPSGGVTYTSANDAPYYSASGDQTTLTSPSYVGTIQLQASFDIQYWSFDASTIADLRGTQALLDVSFPRTDAVVASRAYNGLMFSPASFIGWASLWAAGDDFPAGATVTGISVSKLNLSSTATTLHVRRSYRRKTDAWLNSPPGQAGDIALDTTTFDVTEYSLPVGSHADVRLPLPPVVADAGMVLIHEIWATDSDDDEVALGIGRATLSGASQYQLGFFRMSSTWSNNTVGLAVAIIASVYSAESGNSPAILETRKPGCSGVHGHAGRFAFPFDNSTPKTHRLLMAVPAPFDGLRLVLAHGSTSPVHVARASIKPVGATANVTDTTGFTAATFDGAVDVTIPGVTGTDGISLVRSDVIQVSSVARTDGGELPLILAQAYIDTAATINLMGRSDGGIDRTVWATHPEYPWIARYNDGDCVTTPSSFTSTTNRSTTCIVGVELIARGQVVAVMSVGDSITNGEGSGITYPGASWAFEGCRALNDARPAYYAHFNLGWSGATTESFQRRVEAAFAAGILPDVLVIAAWSPNDISTTINANQITAMRRRVSSLLSLCQAHGVRPVLWTGIPTNATVKDFGASDSLRRAYNDAIRGFAGRGVMVLDFDAALAGATDGDGQVEIASGKTSDGIHPNDSGIADMAAVVVTGLPQLGIEWPAALVVP